MNLLARVVRYLFRDLSLTNPKAWDPSIWNLYGVQSLSGENVTEDSALTISAVFNAVALIAGTIAALPLHLKQLKGKTNRIAEDHSVYDVMHCQWNDYMTAMAGRECLMSDVLRWGNGYAEIVRTNGGDITQLWPIPASKVKPEMKAEKLTYVVQVDHERIRLPRERVLHIPGLGADGFMGYSVIAMARKTLGLAMALESFGSLYFKHGAHASIVLTHPGQLSATAHKNLKESVNEQVGSLSNAHRILLVEEGIKVEKFSIPPEDSQFLESRQFSVTDIARWFNLPPHKLKDLTRSSFSNIESEQRSFYADSLLPWLVRLEQNYNMQLLTAGDRGLYGRGRLYFKHSAEGILRPDAAARADFYQKMLNSGVMSINEVRALEDLDPVDGGDIHLVPLNMTSLEHAGEPPAPPAPKPKALPEPAIVSGNGNE